MIFEAQQVALRGAGLSYILGAQVPYMPTVVREWRAEHPDEAIPDTGLYSPSPGRPPVMKRPRGSLIVRWPDGRATPPTFERQPGGVGEQSESDLRVKTPRSGKLQLTDAVAGIGLQAHGGDVIERQTDRTQPGLACTRGRKALAGIEPAKTGRRRFSVR